MADKWADVLISAVEYSDRPRHIVRVAVHLDRGDSVGPKAELSRAAVISWIGAGYTFATITKGTDKKWQRGADVSIATRDRTKYIRTDADNRAEDNLGKLPEL
jgi:hypothetical protein